jgi:hypothetical protein
MADIRVFVCYSREDSKWLSPEDEAPNLVLVLQDSLRAYGTRFWWDTVGYRGGQ